MGCTQSKIENEEIVNRCKERKSVMKQSVSARNAFAAAHFSYAAALKNTGAALSDYAQGEVEFPDHHRHTDAVPPSTTMLPPAPPQPPYENFPPPPPPPLQRAATMPEFTVTEPELNSHHHPDPIMEGIDEDDEEVDDRSLKHRSRSARAGAGGAGIRSSSKREVEKEDLSPPPSPPMPAAPRPENPLNRAAPPPPPPHGMSSWDYFFPAMENVTGPSLTEIDHENDTQFDRKVVEDEEKNRRERNHHDLDDDVDNGGGDYENEVEDVVEEVVEEEPPPPPPKVVKKVRVEVPVPVPVPTENRRSSGVKLDLLQIFTELDDCFLKASESANEVSKMLEANRLHYHSNFADNRGIFVRFVLLALIDSF